MTSVQERPRATAAARRPTVLLAAILVLVTAGLVLGFRVTQGDPSPAATPANPTVEQQWGVRFLRMGVTADGGMVDVRYVVLDADRAIKVASSPGNTPLLTDESSGRVLFAVAMQPHVHDVAVGGTYYLLYRDTGGLVTPGGRVTVSLGGQSIGPFTVEGQTPS